MKREAEKGGPKKFQQANIRYCERSGLRVITDEFYDSLEGSSDGEKLYPAKRRHKKEQSPPKLQELEEMLSVFITNDEIREKIVIRRERNAEKISKWV